MRKIVIDTDYFNFITMECTDSEILKEVMKELSVFPIIHEFVYKQELHENSFVKKLVDERIIKVYEYSDFLVDEEKEREYRRGFLFAFSEMNGRAFPAKDVKEYHHKEENLGEIHSITMARMLKLDVFMSNDCGARNFVESKLNSQRHNIRVMNIEDTFEEIARSGSTSLSWQQIKNVVRQFKKNNTKTDDERYERIREMWVKE